MKAPLPPSSSVLANMLMKSGINPFDSQEAKPYKNDNEIVAMTNLVTAYQVWCVFFLCISIFPPEQRHQRVWEDPQGEQRDDHGGRFHKRAHRRLAEEHQNPGLNVYSWDPCSEYNLPNRTRCWSNWSSHTPGSRSSSSLGSWTSSLVTLRASSCPASLTTP